MKIAKIQQLIKEINIHINILNELEIKKDINTKEVNDLKDEIIMLQQELFSKLSFSITMETMNSKEFINDIERISEYSIRINEFNESNNIAESFIYDAYQNLELMAEKIILKYSKDVSLIS